MWNTLKPPICTSLGALSRNPSSFNFLHLQRAISMPSGAGGVGSPRMNGVICGGPPDARAGSSTRSLFIPIGGGGDGGDCWDCLCLVYLQLSEHVAPAASKLRDADTALQAANTAVAGTEEGGGFRYTEAKAAYDLAHDE